MQVMNQKMTKGDYGVGVSYKAFEAAVLCKDSGKSQELSFYHKVCWGTQKAVCTEL